MSSGFAVVVTSCCFFAVFNRVAARAADMGDVSRDWIDVDVAQPGMALDAFGCFGSPH